MQHSETAVLMTDTTSIMIARCGDTPTNTTPCAFMTSRLTVLLGHLPSVLSDLKASGLSSANSCEPKNSTTALPAAPR